ncbi:MAG: nucleotidyltransferase family protein [Calditrichaceae bacterium]|nr:nucleotidyltransferase family protein [Calditrichaceae bacterium]HES59202.1 nucleotidyltransferase family protein [Caldithrix sp.]
MKAMILAAGLGTRLRPLTDSIPKALVKINDKTLLEIVINRLKSFGVNGIIINVHHFADQIIQFIKDNNSFDIQIEISKEEDLLDTGGGLKKAAWFFDDHMPFLLHNVDVLSDIDISKLVEFHNNNSAIATLATRTRKTSRYFLTDSHNTLCGWESIQSNEKKMVRQFQGDLSRVSFMGIHSISPELLSYLPSVEKFSIIDAYLKIAENHTIKTMPCDTYRWLDLGKPEQLNQASGLFPELF